jgi:hypothetical protein
MKFLRCLAISLAAFGWLGLSVAPAEADPFAPPGIDESDWRYDLTLYAFVPTSIKGTSTTNGMASAIDFDLGDLLKLLEFAFAGRAEAWNGDWGLIADLNYVNTGANGSMGPISVDLDIQQLVVDFVGSWRFAQFPLGDQSAPSSQSLPRLSIEAMAGMRVNYLKQDIAISPAPAIGGDDAWVEPVIGGRIVLVLDDEIAFALRGDVAGFGVNGDELTWSVTGGVDWRPWETTSIKFGYRVYDMNYLTTIETGPFGLNAMYHGPWLGATFRFQ